MTNEQSVSNNDLQYEATGYKGKNVPCMARGCSNSASFEVKLALVNRYGDFCKGCKRYFEERDLIVSCSTINLGIGEGKIVNLSTYNKEDNSPEHTLGGTKLNAQ